jgi:hypothetical protein
MRSPILVILIFALMAVVLPAQSANSGIYMPSYSDAAPEMDQQAQKSKELLPPSPTLSAVLRRLKQQQIPVHSVFTFKSKQAAAECSPNNIFISASMADALAEDELAAVVFLMDAHIVREDLRAAYDQSAQIYNSLARSGNATEDNRKLLEKFLPSVLAAVNAEQFYAADRMAWESLPPAGYSGDAYIRMLEKAQKCGISGLFTRIPQRIDRIRSYGPPKSPSEVFEGIRLSPYIEEVDPAKFVPVYEGKKVEGYSICEWVKDKIYILSSGGEAKKKKPKTDFLSLLVSPDPMARVQEGEHLSIPGKVTELVVVVKNPTEDKHIMTLVQFGPDTMGLAGHPDKPRDKFEEPKVEQHGDWPYDGYVALSIKLDKLREARVPMDFLAVLTSVFGAKGDEAFQLVEKPSKIKTYRLVLPIR